MPPSAARTPPDQHSGAPAAAPPAPLLALCEPHLAGAEPRWRSFTQGHGNASVWGLFGAGDEQPALFLKRHRTRRKLDAERAAYERWTDALAPHTPRLLAWSREPVPGILVTACRGEILDGQTLAAEREQAAHRAAGALLRRLHDQLFADRDPVPLSQAIPARAASWAARARGLVDDAAIARVRRAVEAGDPFREAVRAPCHRDYSPRNWVVDPDSAVSAIDWEHARPDDPMTDLVRLTARWWRGRPDLERSFLDGYNRPLSGAERARLRALLWLHALSTVVWSVEHEDATFEAEGRACLAALAAGSFAP